MIPFFYANNPLESCSNNFFFFIIAKVHGGLTRTGKVRNNTPKVEKMEKRRPKTGRAKKRLLYNKRFVNVLIGPGKKMKGPNTQLR